MQSIRPGLRLQSKTPLSNLTIILDSSAGNHLISPQYGLFVDADVLLTGAVLAGGSKLIHQIFRFLLQLPNDSYWRDISRRAATRRENDILLNGSCQHTRNLFTYICCGRSLLQHGPAAIHTTLPGVGTRAQAATAPASAKSHPALHQLKPVGAAAAVATALWACADAPRWVEAALTPSAALGAAGSPTILKHMLAKRVIWRDRFWAWLFQESAAEKKIPIHAKESDMFRGASDLSGQAPAYDCQSQSYAD